MSDQASALTPGWYGANPETMDVKGNPHPAYRELRETQPVNLQPDGQWRLSRHRDIQKLLKHSRSGMRHLDGLIPRENREETEASKFMLRMDPPDHDRLRSLVSKAFTPRALASIRPVIQGQIELGLDHLAERDSIDLIADLALPAPVTTTAWPVRASTIRLIRNHRHLIDDAVRPKEPKQILLLEHPAAVFDEYDQGVEHLGRMLGGDLRQALDRRHPCL